MEDYKRVGTGVFKPQCCALCDSYKDLTDTHRELLAWGHVYVCELCITRLARANGLADGPERDKLLSAGRLLEQAEANTADLTERLGALADYATTAKAGIESLRDELAQRDGRIAQLEAAIRDTARAELALVGMATETDPKRGK